MKKNRFVYKFLISAFLLLGDSPLFAQLSVQSQQVLLPKKVYIGDEAELRCTFNSDLDLFKVLNKNEIRQLNINGFTNTLNAKEYEIKKIEFSTTAVNYYTLSITFVPWKTGTIKFPAFDVVDGFTTDENQRNISSLIIKFDDINIVSITEQNSISSLRGPLSPLLIPGTTYKIYLFIVLILALLIAIIEMIIKHKNIRTYLRTQKLLRKYRRNKRATLSALTKLGNSDADDKTVAAGIQQLMRNYLSVRFEGQFANCGASEIMQNFYKVTNHLASEQKEEAVSMIASVFVRTDFIRYSNNSYGKNKSSFLKDEKNKVIENLKNYIQIIEAPEPVKKVDEENAEVKNV